MAQDIKHAAPAANANTPIPPGSGKGDQHKGPEQTDKARMHSKNAKVKDINPDAASGKVHQRSLGEGQK